MTAAATAAVLADRALLAPGSARAAGEIVESINGKTGKVTFTAAGVEAIPASETGNIARQSSLDNLALGTSALASYHQSGKAEGANLAIGIEALANANHVLNEKGEKEEGLPGEEARRTGCLNTAVGAFAGQHITGGYENMAFGGNALNQNNTGVRNVAIGVWALFANTIGRENIAIGQ
jgi:hypothetical protein